MIGRLVRGLKLADRGVAALEIAAVTVALLLMVGLYSAHVVRRGLGHGSIPVFQVATQHLVLWVAMLGASLCVRDRKHISIEVIDKAVTPSGRRVVDGLVSGSTSLVCLLLAYVAWTYVSFERKEYEASRTAEPLFTLFGVALARWQSLLILPVGFTVMAARYALRLLERIFVDQPLDPRAEARKEIEDYTRRHSSAEDVFAEVRAAKPGSGGEAPGGAEAVR